MAWVEQGIAFAERRPELVADWAASLDGGLPDDVMVGTDLEARGAAGITPRICGARVAPGRGRPLEVRVFDLPGGMRPVCIRPYPEVMLRGAPRAVALAPDARLVVVTADAVLELRPERDDRIRELWRTDQLIVDAVAQDEQLVVATLDDRGRRFLTLLF